MSYSLSESSPTRGSFYAPFTVSGYFTGVLLSNSPLFYQSRGAPPRSRQRFAFPPVVMSTFHILSHISHFDSLTVTHLNMSDIIHGFESESVPFQVKKPADGKMCRTEWAASGQSFCSEMLAVWSLGVSHFSVCVCLVTRLFVFTKQQTRASVHEEKFGLTARSFLFSIMTCNHPLKSADGVNMSLYRGVFVHSDKAKIKIPPHFI